MYCICWELSFVVICCLFCSSMFGNLSPTPLFVKAAVNQSKELNQAENWAVEVHHRLAQQRGKKPETTASQVWAVWPDIKSALADGQRIGTIRRLLEEQTGIEITTATLAGLPVPWRGAGKICQTGAAKRKYEMMKSDVLQELVAMVEADAQLRPSPGEFEFAYQARVAMDRIRFAINATETAPKPGEQLREAGIQLLDALDRLDAAERRFQNRWRIGGRDKSRHEGNASAKEANGKVRWWQMKPYASSCGARR
jgi:hypothetical protein